MRQIKWPKWTEQYEEIKENNQVMRKVTSADSAWNWLDNCGSDLISVASIVYRAVRSELI